jgi:hypothetical protein
LVEPFVDSGYLLHPGLPAAMIHFEDGIRRPMKVIGDVGYLLIEPLEGVA